MANFSLKFKRVLLICGDILFLYSSLFFTLKLRFGEQFNLKIWQDHFLPFTFLYIFWIIIFYIFGLYNLVLAKNDLEFWSAISKSFILCAFIGLAFFYLFPSFGIAPKTIIFLNLILFFILFILWRQAFNILIKLPGFYKNIVIIGKNDQTAELKKYIDSNPQLGYKIIDILDPEKEKLEGVAKNYQDFTIITPFNKYPEITKYLYQHLTSIDFEDFITFYEKITNKIPLSQIDEAWFLNNPKEREMEFYEKIKRFFDFLMGIILAIIMIILFIPVVLAIKINSPGPVFYTQKRVGKNGKIFNLIKFRSMIQNAEKNEAVWSDKNDPRITKIGKILRKTLIDELPQSINILKGEMSLIGPRPERPEFVEKLEKEIPFYQARHLIKPGLTGWAQVNYKYGNTIKDAQEKLQYDLFYLKNRSIILDLKIILKTINVAFKGGTQQ